MSEVRKTVAEWCYEYDTVIMSPDGFIGDFNWNTNLFTEKEFLNGAARSTIQFGPKIIKAFDNMRQSGNIKKQTSYYNKSTHHKKSKY